MQPLVRVLLGLNKRFSPCLNKMPEGVKLIDCKLNPQEWEAVGIIRAARIEFGRIIFTTYVENGKIIRVEMEKIIESKKIKS